MSEIKCLTPWDYQGKRLYMKDGIYPTLYSASNSGQQTHGICYAIEGNTVDRDSSKNGRGWCEDISPTLNTCDRHSVVFAIDQQGGKGNCSFSKDVMVTLCSDSHGTPHAVCFRKACKPGADGKGERWQADEICGTLNSFEFHSQVRTPEIVCIEGNGSRESHRGPGFSISNQMYTLNTVEQHSVCYAVDALSSNSMKSKNPNSGFHETSVSKCLDTMCCDPQCNQGGVMVCYTVDCRNNAMNREISSTLQAKDGGGWSVNVTNPVIYEVKNE